MVRAIASRPPTAEQQTPAAAFVETHIRWIHANANRVASALRRDNEHDDVFGDLVVLILNYHRLYDPARGKPSTFIHMIADSYLRNQLHAGRALKRSALTRADIAPETFEFIAGDPLASDPAADLHDTELRATLHRALAALPDRWRAVVCARCGIGGDAETLDRIAARLGVTKERVRQIEVNAFARLAEDFRLRELASAIQE